MGGIIPKTFGEAVAVFTMGEGHVENALEMAAKAYPELYAAWKRETLGGLDDEDAPSLGES